MPHLDFLSLLYFHSLSLSHTHQTSNLAPEINVVLMIGLHHTVHGPAIIVRRLPLLARHDMTIAFIADE